MGDHHDQTSFVLSNVAGLRGGVRGGGGGSHARKRVLLKIIQRSKRHLSIWQCGLNGGLENE